jgi:hypothetical protein
MLRIAALLAMLVGTGTLLGYLQLIGKPPWADPQVRHLRAMKDRVIAPAVVETLTTADFATLPGSLPLAEYAKIEQRGVVVEGYVTHVYLVEDRDLHLDLAPVPDTADYVITEFTPQWRNRSSATRYEPLVAMLRPLEGSATPWDEPPRRVRITGWLLYDYEHEGRIFRHKHGNPITPAWEIHPITRLEVWDDSLAAFVGYPD